MAKHLKCKRGREVELITEPAAFAGIVPAPVDVGDRGIVSHIYQDKATISVRWSNGTIADHHQDELRVLRKADWER